MYLFFSCLCVKGIIDNYARGTYNVLFYFIISKRFTQIFSKLKVMSMQILVLCRKFAILILLGLLCFFRFFNNV
jgi:hypothetical protein